jgi:HTH-type transcriptional regulator/antitoxin HigA
MSYSGETNYAVPTYEYLQEWLDDSDMTRAELARRLDVSPKHVTKLLAGAPLSVDLAARLELVSAVPARIWLQYEAQYRADVVRLSRASQFASEAEYLQQFPWRSFVRRAS